jgi:hypothetical protein
MGKPRKVLHAHAISFGTSTPSSPKRADDEKKASSAARVATVLPEADFAGLKAPMHASGQAVA